MQGADHGQAFEDLEIDCAVCRLVDRAVALSGEAIAAAAARNVAACERLDVQIEQLMADMYFVDLIYGDDTLTPAESRAATLRLLHLAVTTERSTHD